MPGNVALGGKIDAEGGLKFLQHLFRQGYAVGLACSQRSGGANLSVDVAAGGAMLVDSSFIPRYGWTTAVENVPVSAADPSLPRKDTLVAYINLSLITTATTNNAGAFLFKTVPGTPSATPSAPSDSTIQSSVGAGRPFYKIATIDVAAGTSSIVNGNITDVRTPMALAAPYLFGGSNNTLGHLVPNVVDGKVFVSTDAGNVGPTNLSTSAINAGRAKITSDFSSTNTFDTDVPGLTLAVNVPAGGRDVELDLYCRNFSGNGTVQAFIKDNAGTVLQSGLAIAAGAAFGLRFRDEAPTPGVHIYKVAITQTSAGSMIFRGSATSPAQFFGKII